MRPSTLASTALVFSLATTTCSTVTTTSVPFPSIGSPHASSSPCRVTASPIVLAESVSVDAGVEAYARDGRFEVRFAAARSRCVAVDWPSASRERRDAPCPSGPSHDRAMARGEMESTAAAGSTAKDVARLAIGPLSLDAFPSYFGFPVESGQTTFDSTVRAPLGGSRSAEGIGLVPIGGGRSLLLSTEGGTSGRELRAQVVASWGEPLGSTLRLSSPDLTAIGPASAVVQTHGEGLVVYLASSGDEFDVLGASIACLPQ